MQYTVFFFFFQAEDGIRDIGVTGVQTCALPILAAVAFVGAQGVAAVDGNPWLTLIMGGLTAVLAVVGYRWVVRKTEHRPVTELAGPGAGLALGRGTLIGLALFGLVIANIALLRSEEHTSELQSRQYLVCR